MIASVFLTVFVPTSAVGLNSSLVNLSRLSHCLIFKVLFFAVLSWQLYNSISYPLSCQELFSFSFAPFLTERYSSYHVQTFLSIHFLMFFVAHQAVSLYILSSYLSYVNRFFLYFWKKVFSPFFFKLSELYTHFKFLHMLLSRKPFLYSNFFL